MNIVRRAHSRIDQAAPVEGNEQAWIDQLYFVGRAQWEINQAPSLGDNERAWRRGETAGMVSVLAEPPR